jgi:hypothetical protein
MPLPNKRKNEQEDQFMGRCMSDLKSEFPNQKQRVAVCMTQFRKSKTKSANASWDEWKAENKIMTDDKGNVIAQMPLNQVSEEPEEQMMSPEQEQVQELKEYSDDNKEMLVGQLKNIYMKTAQILALIESSEEAPMEITEGWVQNKINLSADYITAVHDYLMSEK